MRRAAALGLLAAWAAAAGAAAGELRVATWNAGLSRSAPGLLLKDIEAGEAQVAAVAEVLRAVRPDILLLTGIDHDAGGAALGALAALVARDGGPDYPHRFAGPVNAGWPSGLDLDGDGSRAGPGDAFGWGRFPGQAGMALLSRLPVAEVHDFRLLPWTALPGAALPVRADGTPFPSAEAQAAMRLSSTAHWDIAVRTPEGPLRLLATAAAPPVFDGPEDRNGLRNADQIRFWQLYLDGAGFPDADGVARRLAEGPVVVLGDLNADPHDGDGRREAVAALLAHPRLTDPAPSSAGGAAAADPGHRGDPGLDTAAWEGPGNLRVDYVLPDRALEVRDAGVFWPAPGAPMAEIAVAASAHRLVWVDIGWPPGGFLDPPGQSR